MVLLSLSQVVQAGIKKHFKAARFRSLQTEGTGRYLSFLLCVLGHDFQITIKHIGEAHEPGEQSGE